MEKRDRIDKNIKEEINKNKKNIDKEINAIIEATIERELKKAGIKYTKVK
jgi:hypothetical protein